MLPQADLVEALEDELFALREQRGAETFPGAAQDYLNDWAENDKGWLRKFYPDGTDEPHFDLTPATEKTLAWLQSKTVCYWGDIDTHGFAILNQLRRILPRAESLLMDQQTLLDHRSPAGAYSACVVQHRNRC